MQDALRFVINLPYRTDRRAEMEQQLDKVGWIAEFFPAVRPEEQGGFPSIGARGCFLSHLAVLKIAKERGASSLIILEDDVNFVDDFQDRWKESMKKLEALDWSIVYPGHILAGYNDGMNLLPAASGIQCTHFMIINGVAIQMLIEGLQAILARAPGDPLGGPMHVDGAYSTLRRRNMTLQTYSVHPPLGYQRSSRTDIAAVQWFDRYMGLGPLVRIGRALKTAIRKDHG